MEDLAFSYLQRDVLLHISMLESLRQRRADLLFSNPKGVLIRDRPSGVYLISATTADVLKQMLPRLDQPSQCVVYQKRWLDPIGRTFSLKNTMECRQAAYLQEDPLSEEPCGAELLPMDDSFLPFLRHHYTAMDGDYLQDRLQAGAILGAFVNGCPAGFIGEHDEGSIGLLEVLPAYRRRGIAAALERRAANRLLSQGRVPFCNVVVGNEPSLRLQRKLGFSVSRKTIFWLYH